jgi:hypothetical protein
MTRIKYSTPLVDYLTINGKYVTPNSTIVSQITGPLSAGDNLTDWKSTPNLHELTFNFTVLSGGPLFINLLVLDPLESSNGIIPSGSTPSVAVIPIILSSSPISGPAQVRFIISRDGTLTLINSNSTPPTGSLAYKLSVPFKWQLDLNVGTGGTASVVATYEGRE